MGLTPPLTLTYSVTWKKKTLTAPTGDHTALVAQTMSANRPFHLWEDFRDNGKTNRTELEKKERKKKWKERREGWWEEEKRKVKREKERKENVERRRKQKRRKNLKKGNQKIRSLG